VALDRNAIARLRAALIAHVLFGMRTAVEAVGHNKLRASLTSLGILFGVASVIAMLAIGKGAEQEIPGADAAAGVQQRDDYAAGGAEGRAPPPSRTTRKSRSTPPGLTYADARALAALSAVEVTSAEVVLNSSITREGLRSLRQAGRGGHQLFPADQPGSGGRHLVHAGPGRAGLPVAIIGHGVRSRFFTTEDPIGKRIKVGQTWLTVLGVLADRRVSNETAQRLGIRDANMDVYVPVHTMLLRFRNRAQLTQRDIELASRPGQFVTADSSESEEQRQERTNRNQLDRIIVRVADSKQVPGVAEIAQRMLSRRHNSVVDFEITMPELLLKQEQRTKTIFNVVLGAIASISLIVGGIGIMNIMLASVLERIREIGVRRAVGATQKDILFQFLSEAVLISVAGGVAGILVGAGLSVGHRAAGRDQDDRIGRVGDRGLRGVVLRRHRLRHRARLSRARQDPVVCLRYE
jgi:putative ABC transport system permease protein